MARTLEAADEAVCGGAIAQCTPMLLGCAVGSGAGAATLKLYVMA
jgi:hypothetical protein